MTDTPTMRALIRHYGERWYWAVHVPCGHSVHADCEQPEGVTDPDHPLYRRRIVHDGWDASWNLALGKALLCMGEEPPVVPKRPTYVHTPPEPESMWTPSINLGPRRRPYTATLTAQGEAVATHRYDNATGSLTYCSLGYPDRQHGQGDAYCPGIQYVYEDSDWLLGEPHQRVISEVRTTSWGKPWQKTPPPSTPTLLCVNCWPAQPMGDCTCGHGLMCPRCGTTSGEHPATHLHASTHPVTP